MIICLSCIVLLFSAGEAASVPLESVHHPWGQHPPQSWRIVQTIIQSNVDGRTVRTSKTMRTVLQAVEKDGITLQESEVLQVDEKNIENRTQTIKYDFFGESIQENVQINQRQPVKLKIGKNIVPCAVRVYEYQTIGGHQTTTVWYTPHVYPYIMRVEKILRSLPVGESAAKNNPAKDNPEGQIVRQSVLLVQDTTAFRTLRGNRKNRLYTVQTVEKVGKTTKITDFRCSWEVPGGLIESVTREIDARGKEIRRSVSRMTNFYTFSQVQSGIPTVAVPTQ